MLGINPDDYCSDPIPTIRQSDLHKLHDLASERVIIDALLYVPGSDVEIFAGVTSSCFYNDELRQIFLHAEKINASGRKVNSLSIEDSLMSGGILQTLQKCLEDLKGLSQDGGLTADALKRVSELKCQREYIQQLKRAIADGLSDSANPREFIERSLSHLSGVANVVNGADLVDMSNYLASAMSEWRNELEGKKHQASLSWPLDVFNHKIGDMLMGQYTIFAAATGNGKTIFGAGVALNSLRQIVDGELSGVLYVSPEMHRKILLERSVCARAGVDIRTARKVLRGVGSPGIEPTREQVDRIKAAVEYIQDTMNNFGQLFLAEKSCSLLDIKALCRQAARKCRLKNQRLRLVIVDYIQMMKVNSKGNQLHADLEEFSTGLMELSRSEHVHIIALAQLNQTWKKEARSPEAEDVAGSSGVVRPADIVLMNHRPFRAIRTRIPPKKEFEEDLRVLETGVEIWVNKNREGAQLMFPVKWEGEFFRFSEMNGDEMEAYESASLKFAQMLKNISPRNS